MAIGIQFFKQKIYQYIHIQCSHLLQLFIQTIYQYVKIINILCLSIYNIDRGRRGRDRMVVGFTICAIIAYHHFKVVISNPAHGEVYSIQLYVIKFVRDLPQVGGLLRFPPPIKLTATM